LEYQLDGGCRGLIEFRAVETLPARKVDVCGCVALIHRRLTYSSSVQEALIEHADRLTITIFSGESLGGLSNRAALICARLGFAKPCNLPRDR
jgi:hypothetical protein